MTQGINRVYGQAETDVHLVALIKGAEKYVFIFDDNGRSETLRTLGRFASNHELSFTWYDAAMLSQRIRNDAGGTPA